MTIETTFNGLGTSLGKCVPPLRSADTIDQRRKSSTEVAYSAWSVLVLTKPLKENCAIAASCAHAAPGAASAIATAVATRFLFKVRPPLVLLVSAILGAGRDAPPLT